MERISAAGRAFLLPELLEKIASYLYLGQLARFSLVNKSIQGYLLRQLWKTYSLGRGTCPIPSPGLAQNLQYVRCVEFQTAKTGLLDVLLLATPTSDPTDASDPVSSSVPTSSWPCTRLTKIVFTGSMDQQDAEVLTHDYSNQMMTLVRQNHGLETLRLPIHEGSIGLVRTLCGLSNLTSLILTAPGSSLGVVETLEVFAMVFELCSLKVLRLPFEATSDSDPSTHDELFQEALISIRTQKEAGRFPCGLKELQLPDYEPQYPGSFIIPFLHLGFPALETLHMSTFSRDEEDDLEKALSAGYKSLTSVRKGFKRVNTRCHEDLESAIAACSNNGGCRLLDCTDVLWKLLQPSIFLNSQCLETLEIKSTWQVSGYDVNRVLISLPSLRRFRIDGYIFEGLIMNFDAFRIYEEEDDSDRGQVQRQSMESNFACTGLKSFQLIASGLDVWGYLETRAFFWQLGRLAQLEELTFGYHPQHVFDDKPMTGMDFFLDPENEGRLEELRSLKKLRWLHLMGGDEGSRIGQLEVEFMEREWPCLERVTITTLDKLSPPLEEQEHWKWFVQKRPWLEVRNEVTLLHFAPYGDDGFVRETWR